MRRQFHLVDLISTFKAFLVTAICNIRSIWFPSLDSWAFQVFFKLPLSKAFLVAV